MTTGDAQREQVRERYAEAARSAAESKPCGCGDTCCDDGVRGDGCCGDECCGGGVPAGDFGEALYSPEERGELPAGAALASLGCDNPIGP